MNRIHEFHIRLNEGAKPNITHSMNAPLMLKQFPYRTSLFFYLTILLSSFKQSLPVF